MGVQGSRQGRVRNPAWCDQAVVAAERIQKFLQRPEVSASDCAVMLSQQHSEAECRGIAKALPPQIVADLPSASVLFSNASFVWDKTENSAVRSPFSGLHDVSLVVKRGELVGIIGVIGSGKSSLLSALLGHMVKTSGVTALRGRVAYATQNAWIFNDTLRNNVLFGLEYDEQRFRNAVQACALGSDLDQLPGREETEIGERGINLSGGQKARVSMARLVYDNPDVALLDDPLSAVGVLWLRLLSLSVLILWCVVCADVHVGKHLWEHCVKVGTAVGYPLPRWLAHCLSCCCVLVGVLQGALAGKTRLLVTHQLQYVKDCDRIVVMQGGMIAHQGSYDQLIAAGVDLAGFVTATEDETTPVVLPPTLPHSGGCQSTAGGETLPNQPLVSVALPKAPALIDSAPHTPIVKKRSAQSRADLVSAGRLITKEFRVEGSVRKNTLSTYLSVSDASGLVRVGVHLAFMSVFLLLLAGCWWHRHWGVHGVPCPAYGRCSHVTRLVPVKVLDQGSSSQGVIAVVPAGHCSCVRRRP
jgi:ABC-type nitrate/sulfonate/bicarbonate transport system ATPase subunit